MQYPKLTILMVLVVLVLGEAAFADRTYDSALFRTSGVLKDASGEVTKRIDWRMTRWLAARGNACAIGRVAAAHHFGHTLVGFEYSGLDFNREKAAALFERSVELGCENTKEATFFFSSGWPDQLAPYRDDEGRVEWKDVKAAASTGDPDARFHVAMTMRKSRNQARRRGIEYDPERGTEMLGRLAQEGHMDALVEIGRSGSGITPELNRAYYALMDTTWKPFPTLRIHMRLLDTAITDCNPSAWAKAMDIWSTMGQEIRSSERVEDMLGDAPGEGRGEVGVDPALGGDQRRMEALVLVGGNAQTAAIGDSELGEEVLGPLRRHRAHP